MPKKQKVLQLQIKYKKMGNLLLKNMRERLIEMSSRRRVISVILAGGFGTRLFPLTSAKPKPLVKILDTPVLEHVISNVKKTSAEKIVVSTFYKTDMIEKKCREIDEKIVCKKDRIPLGTAGGVKNCCGGEYDAVLVVSGDGVFDIDLQKVIDYHFEKNNDVTIVTSHKYDPTRYGVVICDDDNSILKFDEKPMWKNVRSDRVNTGIYVISKEMIDRIPENKVYDFSLNLFPSLMKEGRRLKAFSVDGFWCDIGTHEEYYTCNLLAAEGKLGCIPNDGENYENLNRCGIHVQEGVYVSKKARIGKNVRINGAGVVCRGVVIADNCDISGSVISENTLVGAGSSISCAIIGEEVSIGENCIVPKGVVIGDKSRIPDGTVLKCNTCIDAGNTVTGRNEEMVEFLDKSYAFADDGKMLFEDIYACRKLFDVALAISIACRKRENGTVNIGIMGSGGCNHLKNVLSSVLVSQGNTVFDCGEGNEAMCSFAVKKLNLGFGFFLTRENNAVAVTFFDDEGSVIDENNERKLLKILSQIGTNTKDLFSVAEKAGKTVLTPIEDIYKSCLERFLSNMLSGANLEGVKLCMPREQTEKNLSVSVMSAVLGNQGCTVTFCGTGETVSISVSDDGQRATVRCGNRVFDHEHICALIFKNADVLGIENANLSCNAPLILKKLSGGEKTGETCELPIIGDACACLAAFSALMSLKGGNVLELFAQLPPFEIYKDEYIADINRGATMERLSRLYSDSKDDGGDGIRLCLAEGNVTVIPSKAKGFKIVAEAVSMEAAKELAVKIGKVIKNEDEERK